MIANYYSIAGNIDGPVSSVFMSEPPSLGDYDRFARRMPSYAFVVVLEEDAKSVVSLRQDPCRRLPLVPRAYAGQFGRRARPDGGPGRGAAAGGGRCGRTVQGEGGQVQLVFNETAHNVLPFEAVLPDVVDLVRENVLNR